MTWHPEVRARTPVPPVLRRLVTMVATATAGLSACSLSLVSGDRPVVTMGAAGAVAVVGALVSGWRWLASVASLTVTAAVLFAAAVSSDEITSWHLVGASALIVVLVTGLDRVERPARPPGTGPGPGRGGRGRGRPGGGSPRRTVGRPGAARAGGRGGRAGHRDEPFMTNFVICTREPLAAEDRPWGRAGQNRCLTAD
jgi:hypothetical protein